MQTSIAGRDGPFSPSPVVTVRNVVAACRVAERFDLADLAAAIPGAEYDRRRFAGVIVRLPSPRVAALIFGSGKIIFTGLRDPADLPGAHRAIVRALTAAGVGLLPDLAPPCVVNLVTTGTFPDGIALHRFALARDLENVEYEPEVFPGLLYRAPGGVALLFSTGAIVVNGTRTIAAAAAFADAVGIAIDRAGAWMPRPVVVGSSG